MVNIPPKTFFRYPGNTSIVTKLVSVEVLPGTPQTSKMESFATIVDRWSPFAVKF